MEVLPDDCQIGKTSRCEGQAGRSSTCASRKFLITVLRRLITAAQPAKGDVAIGRAVSSWMSPGVISGDEDNDSKRTTLHSEALSC